MQTVSKTYGAAADTEAQAPAPQEKPALGRAKVAFICVAAALSGAAVASVARVRTRAYVADLVGVDYRMGGKNLEPPPHSLKKPCYLARLRQRQVREAAVSSGHRHADSSRSPSRDALTAPPPPHTSVSPPPS